MNREHFKGTDIAISLLLTSIESGGTIDDFLAEFPRLTRSEVEAVLQDNHYYADMAAANKVMEEDREMLSLLARS